MVREATSRPSWGTRVVAPLAFFAAATILVLLVQDALNARNDPAEPAVAQAEPGTSARTDTSLTRANPSRRPAHRRFYVIRDGDTLETIAERFGTTVDDLLSLNPNIEPNALTPGQRIRIR